MRLERVGAGPESDQTAPRAPLFTNPTTGRPRCRRPPRCRRVDEVGPFFEMIPIGLGDYTLVMARCAQRAVAIQLDGFVAALLVMTGLGSEDVNRGRRDGGLLEQER